TCREPERILRLAGSGASARKFRLFGVACCRRLGNTIRDGRSREAVEAAEAYADGLGGADRLASACWAARQGGDEPGGGATAEVAAWPTPAGFGEAPEAGEAVQEEWANLWVEWAGRVASATSRLRGGADERATQADLARCVFGRPERAPVSFRSTTLAH